jgi:hypothetical protein
MDNLVIEGKLVQVLPVQEGVSTRGAWKKQDFILETADQYPKKICVSCWNEKADEIQKYQPNDQLKVSINIESREYNSRWYTDIKAWRIEGSSSPSAANSSAANTSDDSDITGISFSSDDEGDLPF